MNGLAVLIGLVLVLFIAAYFTKKRFGILGLALIAGSFLSGLWTYEGGLMASVLGFQSGSLTNAFVAIAIIIAPSLILMVHGYSYSNKIMRVMGSVAYALFAAILLMTPIRMAFDVSDVGSEIFLFISNNYKLLVSGCIIAAIIDVFIAKTASKGANKKGKH